MNLGTAAFGQNPLVIAPGTEVIWTNNDLMSHTVTSTTNFFDSGSLAPGATYSYTFGVVGTYPYYCTIHGRASMSGVISVQSASSTGAGGSTGGGY
jgi:plastocyanin